MSSSKRWSSATGAEMHGPSPLHAAALSPVRHSGRRSVSRSDPVPAAGAVSVSRTLWPSSSGDNIKNGNKAPRAPSPTTFSASPLSSVVTLADHLAKDDTPAVAAPQSLSRQFSCIELPRFADDGDAEAKKIGSKSSGKGGGGHAFGRSMRFFPSTKPAGVTLTPGRVAPSDLRRLAGADAASSGSECSDAASRGSTTPRTVSSSKPRSPLLPRTSSVRLLGSSNTQWALSPGRRSRSPLKTTTTMLATVPEASKSNKKSLISLGWGHLFNRRKHATDDASLAAAAATLLSSPVSSRTGRGGGEAGHEMRMAHCRLLQWRFANAREDAVRKRKLAGAEVELMGTWASVSELRGKVARKRVQLEKEKLKMKLNPVLSSQIKYLESWDQIESKHASALASTVDCARAAVYRVPLTNGAKVSMPSLASTLQHVLELVMTTRSTTRPFGSTAQKTTSVVSELLRVVGFDSSAVDLPAVTEAVARTAVHFPKLNRACGRQLARGSLALAQQAESLRVAREEQALLHECLELLGRFSSLQVEEQSLRCHMVQSSSLTCVTLE